MITLIIMSEIFRPKTGGCGSSWVWPLCGPRRTAAARNFVRCLCFKPSSQRPLRTRVPLKTLFAAALVVAAPWALAERADRLPNRLSSCEELLQRLRAATGSASIVCTDPQRPTATPPGTTAPAPADLRALRRGSPSGRHDLPRLRRGHRRVGRLTPGARQIPSIPPRPRAGGFLLGLQFVGWRVLSARSTTMAQRI